MARYLGLFDDGGKAIGDDVELFRALHTHTYEATQLRNLGFRHPLQGEKKIRVPVTDHSSNTYKVRSFQSSDPEESARPDKTIEQAECKCDVKMLKKIEEDMIV